ncbi:hypothetical protein [Legionella hackeliae]|uniref:Secreted protein n=1 Tax=Legionella hackeliae TaxID=449 RepID=A0A0A8USL3_LEGHA|nr:hypothetical protein [Legionella hackeliae]KTD09985.1 hypothetical protein Lhac_2353 [Legionella hackeliae]CEK11713.1 exported protein of unknown function [Legionella hackeliae]STX48483.1 Uncharacterised protein [Legionella hackeliae]
MPRSTIIAFFLLISCINLDSWADEFNKSNFPGILKVEGAIYKAAVKKGLNESDISISWQKMPTDEYKAIIKCINANKCGDTFIEIFISA